MMFNIDTLKRDSVFFSLGVDFFPPKADPPQAETAKVFRLLGGCRTRPNGISVGAQTASPSRVSPPLGGPRDSLVAQAASPKIDTRYEKHRIPFKQSKNNIDTSPSDCEI